MRIIENEGGGAVLGVPGYSGAIRAKLADDGTVLEVVPWGQPFADEREAPEETSVKKRQRSLKDEREAEDESSVPPEQASQGG